MCQALLWTLSQRGVMFRAEPHQTEYLFFCDAHNKTEYSLCFWATLNPEETIHTRPSVHFSSFCFIFSPLMFGFEMKSVLVCVFLSKGFPLSFFCISNVASRSFYLLCAAKRKQKTENQHVSSGENLGLNHLSKSEGQEPAPKS